jgi:CheY-like chemotaxis protein
MSLLLYAEDDPDDACLFRMAAKRRSLPFTIAVVEDGQAAIDWLAGVGHYGDRKKHPLPTVLIVDLKMPRRSGLDVLGWARAQKGLEDLPIVVLSSSGEGRDVQQAAELGATSYFVKNASFQEILDYLAASCASPHRPA